MAEDLRKSLDSQVSACSAIIEGKRKRINDLANLLRAKNSAYVDTANQFQETFSALEKAAIDGLEATCTQLHADLLRIDAELISEFMRMVTEQEKSYGSLVSDRKRFETEYCVQQLRDRIKEFRRIENDLAYSLTEEMQNEVVSLEQEIYRLRESIESVPAEQIREKHQLEFDTDILHRKIEDGKKELRNLKKQTIKLHSHRNALRDELFQTETTAIAANKKQSMEFRRLVKNIGFFTKKFEDIEKINNDKYTRIYKSNVEEIGYLSNQLKEAIRRMYLNIFNVEWTEPEEKPEEATETGTVAGKSSLSGNGVKYSKEKIKQVFDLIEKEMSFLLTRDSPGIEGILEYLGVKGKSDLDLLISSFYVGQEEDDEELYVEQSDCINIIKEFLTEKEAKHVLEIASGKRKEKESDRKLKTKLRERVKRETEKIWNRLSRPIPESQIKELEEINKILQQQLTT